MASEAQRLWYVRLGEEVRGPFPTTAVAQDLALGRLPPDTLVSTDRVSWTPASALEAFSRFLQPADAWAEERRQALRRWADERSGQERRASAGGGGVARGGERRQGGSSPRTATDRTTIARPASGPTWLVFGGLAVVLLALLLLALLFGPAGIPDVRLLE